jgi:hypothetical protein
MKITQKSDQRDRDYIRKKGIEHNMTQLPEELKTPKEEVCFFLESEEGDILGGVTGTMFIAK